MSSPIVEVGDADPLAGTHAAAAEASSRKPSRFTLKKRPAPEALHRQTLRALLAASPATFDATFTERRLGFAVVLAKYASSGRAFVRVTSTTPGVCEASVKPTDELAAVDGEPVLSPDAASLAALIGGILSGPRPLTFTFAGGARRVAAFDAQERKRSSEGADDARARSCREACGRAEALLEECREWSRGGGGDAHLAAAAGRCAAEADAAEATAGDHGPARDWADRARNAATRAATLSLLRAGDADALVDACKRGARDAKAARRAAEQIDNLDGPLLVAAVEARCAGAACHAGAAGDAAAALLARAAARIPAADRGDVPPGSKATLCGVDDLDGVAAVVETYVPESDRYELRAGDGALYAVRRSKFALEDAGGADAARGARLARLAAANHARVSELLARARSRKRRPRAREVAEEVSLEERRADSPTYARFQRGDLRNAEPLSYNSLMSLDDDEKGAEAEKRKDSRMSLDDSKSGRAPSPWSVYEAAFVRREVAAGRLTDASLEDMLEPEDADAPPPLPPAPLLVEEEEAELLREPLMSPGVPAPTRSREEAEAAPPPAEEPATPPATRSRPSSPPAEAAPEPPAREPSSPSLRDDASVTFSDAPSSLRVEARGSSAPASLRDYRDDVSVSVASEAPSSLVAAASSDGATSPGPSGVPHAVGSSLPAAPLSPVPSSVGAVGTSVPSAPSSPARSPQLRDLRDDASDAPSSAPRAAAGSSAPSSPAPSQRSVALSQSSSLHVAASQTRHSPFDDASSDDGAAPPPPPSPGRLAFRGPSASDLAAIDPRPDRAASPSAGGLFAPFSERRPLSSLYSTSEPPSPPIPSAFSSPVVSGSSAPPSVRGDASVVSCDADGRSPRDAPSPDALAGALSPTTFSRLTDSFLNLRASLAPPPPPLALDADVVANGGAGPPSPKAARPSEPARSAPGPDADDIGRLVGDDVADMVSKVKATRANRKKKPKRRRAPSV